MDKFIASYDEQNNVLNIKIKGLLEAEDMKELIPLYERLLEDKPRRYVLVDMTESAKFDASSMTKEMRNSYKELMKVMSTDKSAIFEITPAMRMVAKIGLAVSGKSDVTKFFKTKEQALVWLKGDDK